MASNKVVNQDEWQAARQALLTREKELTRAMEQLHTERRQLPWVRIDKDYTLDGPAGAVSLADLFEGRRQLVIYHFMFAPDWKAGCDGCSFLVDSIGNQDHLHAGNTTIALVSHAKLPKLQAYQPADGLGRQEEDGTMHWIRRHDEYNNR